MLRALAASSGSYDYRAFSAGSYSICIWVLGRSTLEMTRRYANLVTADLQAVHERVTLLSSR
jgi:hypothetical protein